MSDLVRVSVSLTQDDLNDAVRAWLEKRGLVTSDSFRVAVRTIPGDRPFDSDYTEISVDGVFVKGGGE